MCEVMSWEPSVYATYAYHLTCLLHPPHPRCCPPQVIRGDWFVTSGSELNAAVVVYDAVGREVYREGACVRACARVWACSFANTLHEAGLAIVKSPILQWEGDEHAYAVVLVVA